MIAIVGPRAAGKTTLGRSLATSLGWRFVDLDDSASSALGGRTPAQVFRAHGEEVWRAAESVALVALPEGELVVALGAGAPWAPGVCAELRRRAAFVVLLDADPLVTARRILEDPSSREQRPPLQGDSPRPDLQGLFHSARRQRDEREPGWSSISHLRVDGGRPLAEVLHEVEASVRDRLRYRKPEGTCES